MGNRTRKLPIRLYLDTSDYSRFADISYRNEPGIPDILDFLREKKGQGLIEIRFSATHLFEFLKDPSQQSLALRKVRIVEELCGEHAFLFFGDVFEREVEALSSGSDPASVVISDNGEWAPVVELGDSFSLDTFIESVQKQIPHLNANQIRALIADPNAAAFLNENMSKEFPLANFYGTSLIQDFLRGIVCGRGMQENLVKDFLRPSTLIEHYLDGDPKVQKFFGILAQAERSLRMKLVEVQQGLRERLDLALKFDPDILKEVRRLIQPYMRESFSLDRGLDDLPENIQRGMEKGQYLKELPALSTYNNVFTVYIRDIFYPSLTPPEIKESDAADILHAIYMPYVDFYRTDGRFGALLNKVSKPSTVKVVPKLSQLREAIERELEGSGKVSDPPRNNT